MTNNEIENILGLAAMHGIHSFSAFYVADCVDDIRLYGNKNRVADALFDLRRHNGHLTEVQIHAYCNETSPGWQEYI